MKKFQEILDSVTRTTWETLKTESLAWGRYCHPWEWWNTKYYSQLGDDHGYRVQYDQRHNMLEVPYLRKLFYPNEEGRFGLNDQPVAYFSDNSLVNACEVVDQFHDTSDLTWRQLFEYSRGKIKPTGNEFGYPMNFQISKDAAILDLSDYPKGLFSHLRKFGDCCCELVSQVIASRDLTSRIATQRISIYAKEAGFDGIVYRSVRAPIDVNWPDKNLVMFTESKVTEWSPSS